MKPSIALVVTTYNRPRALARVLESMARQSEPAQEILIADDGSREDTRELIELTCRRLQLPAVHVWHRDQGFRAAAIRNRAIAASTADYVVFIDGDCILPRDFVAQHRALAEVGWFVAGNRVLLSPGFTEHVELGGKAVDLDEPLALLRHRLQGHVNRVLPRIRLSAQARWRYRAPQRWEGARTCNLAVWRHDLLAVDGFDEAYSGWGMEDSDLVIRLLKHGVRHKDGRYATGVYHLWHRENDRSRLAENVARLQALQQDDRIRAEHGLSQPVDVTDGLSCLRV